MGKRPDLIANEGTPASRDRSPHEASPNGGNSDNSSENRSMLYSFNKLQKLHEKKIEQVGSF